MWGSVGVLDKVTFFNKERKTRVSGSSSTLFSVTFTDHRVIVIVWDLDKEDESL